MLILRENAITRIFEPLFDQETDMLLKLPTPVRPSRERLREALLERHLYAEGVLTLILMVLIFVQTVVIFSVILPFAGPVAQAAAVLADPGAGSAQRATREIRPVVDRRDADCHLVSGAVGARSMA